MDVNPYASPKEESPIAVGSDPWATFSVVIGILVAFGFALFALAMGFTVVLGLLMSMSPR